MMNDAERIELSIRKQDDDIVRLRGMYREAERAYQETHGEWSKATEQARLWHRYEQALVSQRNAMQSALSSLWTAIKAVEEIDAMNRGDE